MVWPPHTGDRQRERQLLAEGLAAVQAELVSVRRTAAAVGPELQRGTREAVRTAVAESLKGAGGTAVRAVETASRPLLDQLAGVAASARAVEASLRAVVGWVTWRLLWRLVAGVAGLLMLMAVARVGLQGVTGRFVQNCTLSEAGAVRGDDA